MTSKKNPLAGLVGYDYIAEQLGVLDATARTYGAGPNRVDGFPRPVETPPGVRITLFDKHEADSFIAERLKVSRRKPRPDGRPRRSRTSKRAELDLVGYAYIAEQLGVVVQTVRNMRASGQNHRQRVDYFPEPIVQNERARSPLWTREVADAFIARRREELSQFSKDSKGSRTRK